MAPNSLCVCKYSSGLSSLQQALDCAWLAWQPLWHLKVVCVKCYHNEAIYTKKRGKKKSWYTKPCLLSLLKLNQGGRLFYYLLLGWRAPKDTFSESTSIFLSAPENPFVVQIRFKVSGAFFSSPANVDFLYLPWVVSSCRGMVGCLLLLLCQLI